jgi:N-acetylmuramoyl-L-alanine amidase
MAGLIGLVVGHNARAQGAVRVTDGRTEFDWCGDLAAAIAAFDPARYVVLRRRAQGGYNAEIREVYAQADARNVAATVELHFNGGGVGATGTETLTSGTARSRGMALLVQAGMVRALGLRDRGLLVRGRLDRGGASLWAGRAPAVMIEPYFGSNPRDCAAADRAFAQLAREIHGACMEFVK